MKGQDYKPTGLEKLIKQWPAFAGLACIAADLGYVWYAKTYPPHLIYPKLVFCAWSLRAGVEDVRLVDREARSRSHRYLSGVRRRLARFRRVHDGGAFVLAGGIEQDRHGEMGRDCATAHECHARDRAGAQ